MAMAMQRPRALPERSADFGVTPALTEAGRSDITLLLERPRSGEDGNKLIESVSVLSNETIANVKLKLRARKQWFAAGCKLACGDRELLDHEIVGRVAGNSVDFLHVFVRMSDIDSLTVTSRSNARASLDYRRTADRSAHSALTALLSSSQDLDQQLSRQLPLAGTQQPAVSDQEDAILHLVVRRGAQVGWHGHEDSFELSVARTETADNVRQRITATSGWDASSHILLYKGQVLASDRPLSSYGLGKGSLLELQPMEPRVPSFAPSSSPPLSSPDHGLYTRWQRARAGLAKGLTPTLAEAGSGGSYFIPGEDGRRVAVFKPADEEPLAANNPRAVTYSSSGVHGEGYGLRKGICPGEGAVREVAAFLLDHQRFAGVPPTALVSCSGFEAERVRAGESAQAIKVGSLQAYVTADGDCEEQGCSRWPVQQVHKIAVLDIRLVNTDRNGGNILAKRREGRTTCSWELTPIDHGYCLPGSLEDASFEWLWWGQAAEPFNQACLDYISRLDADQDIDMLRAQGLKLRPECERVLKVGTLVLRMGASRGCTARDIGCIMCRECTGKSPIEKLHAQAVKLAVAEQHTLSDHNSDLALVHLERGQRDLPGSPMAVHLVGDEAYLKHLTSVLNDYFDERLLADLQ